MADAVQKWETAHAVGLQQVGFVLFHGRPHGLLEELHGPLEVQDRESHLHAVNVLPVTMRV